MLTPHSSPLPHPGYLAIYLLGLDLGHYLLPTSPSYAYRPFRPSPKSRPRPAKLVPILVGFAAVWWALLGSYLGLVGTGGVLSTDAVPGPNKGEWVSGRDTSRRLVSPEAYLLLLAIAFEANGD